jgi:hypothetical protein
MLTATKSGSNIILKSSLTVSFQLERKFNTGSWEPWTGSGWGGVPISLTEQNFTDYDLSDGIYQYRTFTTTYEYSTCIPIGSEHVGWTFRNYSIPTDQFGEILTSDDLHYSFLWGIDLTASNGEPWSDNQSKTFVEWAVYQIEKKLNIHIFPRTIYCDDDQNEDIEEEKLVLKEFPYPNRRNQRYNLRMRHRPIREVTRFEFFSPQAVKILDLLNWMRIDRRNGQLNYTPKQGANQSFTINSYPWNLLLNGYGYRDAFHIDYTTGYKNAELIPEDLRDIIGKIAALKALNVVGDGLLAGFSSSSISLDGMSESFSSTQSATSISGSSNVFGYGRINVMFVRRNKIIGKNILSKNRKTGELEFKKIVDIYKHDCKNKISYKIWCGKEKITITEDHSLFDEKLNEIKGSDIKIGTILSGESNRIVTKIKKVRIKWMYDLCVDDNENFYSNGFMCHNSAYFGARIKVYQDEIKEYIDENQNKYGNFRIGSF